jgi:DNA-binding response OmpR family regulator
MERAVAAGAFGYVLKPFNGAGLKAAIETALHKHQTEVENLEPPIRPLEIVNHVTSDMEHRLNSLCATQVSRPVFLPGRNFCLEGIWVQ